MVEKIQVKLLELGDEKLEALALARIFGLIPASSIIDSLAHSAPAASAALGELAQGNLEKFHAILGPTVPMSRHIFKAPTRFYKTGVVFMAWLNGHQKHFTMVGGQQSTRSVIHLAELFKLADAANLLEQPDLAVHRLKTMLAMHGIE